MEERVLIISPDGQEVCGLYSDKFPWKEIGELSIERVSDIKFNNHIQRWEIYIRHLNKALPKTFGSREKAIVYEIDYIHKHIKEMRSVMG